MTPVLGTEKEAPASDLLDGQKPESAPATPLDKASKNHMGKTALLSNKQDSTASKNSSKGGQSKEVIQKYSPQDPAQSKSAQAELREKFSLL